MARFDGKSNRQRASKMVIKELSGVDIPAHSGATVSIFKMYEKNTADLLTSEVDGHQHGVKIESHSESDSTNVYLYVSYASGESEENSHSHDIVYDEFGNAQLSVNEGHTHEIDGEQLRSLLLSRISVKSADMQLAEKTSIKDLISLIDKNVAIGGGNENQLNPGDNTMGDEKTAAELEKAVTQLTTELAKSQKLAELNDEEKSYYKSLAESEQSVFIEKSHEDRVSEINKSKQEDSIVYKAMDGTEFRKSDDPRMVESIKRADAMQKRLDEEIEKREMVELEKRANDELGNLPGENVVKVAVLKAIDSIEDEGIRKGAKELLKSGNDKLAKAFERRGTSLSKSEDINATDKLDQLAKTYAKDNSVSFAKAYSAVLETKEGRELYSDAVQQS